MMKNVVVVGACDAVGMRISDDLEAMGLQVIRVALKGQSGGEFELDPLNHENALAIGKAVAEKMDAIDMLVINIDGTDVHDARTILEEQNFDELILDYQYNTVGPLRALNAFMPLLERGEGKRICIVTTAEGSNSACSEMGGFGRHMSKASLNMAANLVFNGLRPEGYTMRMYCKDLYGDPRRLGAYAAEYFTRNRSNEVESYKHSDENRLVLRDSHARELPW